MYTEVALWMQDSLGFLHIIPHMEENVENRNGQVIGYAFAVLQAVLYSTMGILGKLLYATGMDSQQVVILRFLCSILITSGPD